MNSDAEHIIKENTRSEEIRELLEVMKQLCEKLEYLIEILE